MSDGKASELVDRGFDWRKSPAHFLFLSTFLEPRPPDKDHAQILWTLFLGEPTEQAIERLMKDNVLRVCGTTQTLRHELPKLPIVQLREILRERDLPISGTKEELIERLLLRFDPSLIIEISDCYLLECSDLGKELAENHLQDGLEAMVKEYGPDGEVTIKKILMWLLGDLNPTSVTYDLLKRLFGGIWPDEPIPTPKITPVPSPPDGTTVSDKTPEPPSTQSGKTTLRNSSIYEPELVYIPSGYFLMGSSDSDKDANKDEKPQHRLYLDAYLIGKYPITISQFAAFVENTGYQTTAERDSDYSTWRHPRAANREIREKDKHPVTFVSWVDAIAYCHWLTQISGRRYTLPSEAEWEKAARGTDGKIYPWGNVWDKYRCNTYEAGKYETTPVELYSPLGDSPYGCADMIGNVWEWTRSLWREGNLELDYTYPYTPNDGRENLNVAAKNPQVLRGGSFVSFHRLARCASRGRYDPYDWNDFIGFRVVVSPLSLDSGHSESLGL